MVTITRRKIVRQKQRTSEQKKETRENPTKESKAQ